MTQNFPIHFLWIIGFIAALFPVNSWQLGCLFIGFSALIVWGGIALYQNHHKLILPRSPVLYFVAAFWVLAFASLFWSEIPFVSILGFCVLSALPLTILIAALNDKALPFEKMLPVLFGIFCVLGAWALIQFFFLNDLIDGRARHPLANPNALAVIFNLGFFLALMQSWKVEDLKEKIFPVFTAILCIAGLMMTGSRGALIALLPALIFFLSLQAGSLRKNARVLILLLVCFIGFFALTSIGPNSAETISTRVAETVAGTSPYMTGNRINIWDGALGVALNHGLVGTGIGTFFLYYNEYRSPLETSGVSHAHSDPVQFLSELGITGFVLFYAILISALMRTIKALRVAPKEGTARLQIIGSFAALLAVAVQAHYSFPLYNFSILFLGGFIFAFWFQATQAVSQTQETEILCRLKPDLRGAVLIVPLICLWGVFSLIVASEHFVNKARVALFSGQLEEMAAHLETANRLGFQANARGYLLAVNVPLSLLDQKDVPLTPQQRKDMYEEALFYLDQAQRFHPRSPSIYYYRARAIDLAGEEKEQIENLYRKTLRIDPLHLGARLALADYYKAQGEDDKSYNVLVTGLPYMYRVPLTQRYLGRVMTQAIARGDTDTQQKAMQSLKLYHALVKKTEQQSRSGALGVIFAREKRADISESLGGLF